MNKKPPLGIRPRHFWFKERIDNCLHVIQQASEIENWENYRKFVLNLGEELVYCCKEWEKYYQESEQSK